MKVFFRYAFLVIAILIGILIFVNIPKLATAMLETVSKVSWQDWAKYVTGIAIGSGATLFAMKEKKKVKNKVEDNSKADY